MSLDYIITLQTEGRSPFAMTYYNLVKRFGSSEFIYGTLLLIYVFKERALALHYTLIISAMMFFLSFLKMVIRFPRPYQYSIDIIPITCSGQYGCPSGTTLRSTTVLVSLFLDFVQAKSHKLRVGEYLIFLSITGVSVISVMASRVYLAAHSIN